MKKFRKHVSLLLCAALLLCLFSGCGASQAPAETETPTEPAPDYNRLVEVTSEEARTAVLADGTLELAAQLPDAAWNSLPKWNGLTISNLYEYGAKASEQSQFYSKEDM